ncbi:MAG TPA: YlxR family protein [Dehalococcoidia bacterium]|nr:YlxR family protein [Dehalococcoidia bacterium]
MVKPLKRVKHFPERTCIACRKKRPKWELVRIVRTPGGSVEIDLRGKKAGRGTYLCKQQKCWEIGLARKRLERTLNSDIVAAERAELVAYSRTLPEVVEASEVLP